MTVLLLATPVLGGDLATPEASAPVPGGPVPAAEPDCPVLHPSARITDDAMFRLGPAVGVVNPHAAGTAEDPFVIRGWRFEPLTDTAGPELGGVLLNGTRAHVVIEDNCFSDHEEPPVASLDPWVPVRAAAVALLDAENVTVRGNLFEDNDVAVSVQGGDRVAVEDNAFRESRSAVLVDGAGEVHVVNNTVADGRVEFRDSADVTAARNTVAGGIEGHDLGRFVATANRLEDVDDAAVQCRVCGDVVLDGNAVTGDPDVVFVVEGLGAGDPGSSAAMVDTTCLPTPRTCLAVTATGSVLVADNAITGRGAAVTLRDVGPVTVRDNAVDLQAVGRSSLDDLGIDVLGAGDVTVARNVFSDVDMLGRPLSIEDTIAAEVLDNAFTGTGGSAIQDAATVRFSRNTIVDARSITIQNSGPTLFSDNTLLDYIGIVGFDHLARVDVLGNLLKRGSGIWVTHSGPSHIANNTFADLDNYAIQLSRNVDASTVVDNTIRNVSVGMTVSADGTVVARNHVEAVGWAGFRLFAAVDAHDNTVRDAGVGIIARHGAHVHDNVLQEVFNCGIAARDSGVRVERNAIHVNDETRVGASGCLRLNTGIIAEDVDDVDTDDGLSVLDNEVEGGETGVLAISDGSLVAGNRIANASTGILVPSLTEDVGVSGNRVANASTGIDLSMIDGAVVDNRVLDASRGILVSGAGVDALHNTVTGVEVGLALGRGGEYTIHSNVIEASSDGFRVEDFTFPNLIYNNHVTAPTPLGGDVGRINAEWAIAKTDALGPNIVGGPYWCGNFWSAYDGEDLDGDGLGDTDVPFALGGDEEDPCPLVP